MEVRNYSGSKRCGLCLSMLPWDGVMSSTKFRADVALLSPSNESMLVITDPSTFPSDGTGVSIHIDNNPTQTVIIGSWNRPKDQTAYCFHDVCYSYMVSIEGCSSSKIYRLARTLSGAFMSSEAVHGRALDSKLHRIFAQLANSNPNSMALASMQCLPLEVRHIIWEYVGLKTAASAFTIVTGETACLAKSLRSPGRQELSLHPRSQICLGMIDVFGTSYIQTFEHGDVVYTIPSVVDHLSFATAFGGICAVKMSGIDWNSGWLGKLPVVGPVWFGTISEPGSKLTCDFNDLYCTFVSSKTKKAGQVLWDQESIPVCLPQPYPDRPCYLKYLSLLNDDEYASGLSMYHSGNGIVGLEAHFARTSRLSGIRNGCPIYLPLGPQERIDFVWRRVYKSRGVHMTPAFVVRTTLGRTCTFGSYILPEMIKQNRYEWIGLNTRGHITGFYFETPTVGLSITELEATACGTTTLATKHPTPQYIACSVPTNISAGADAGLYLSCARLSGLDEVRLCWVGRRCAGMMLRYLCSPPEVLGQWYTSCSKLSSVDVRNASTMHVERSQSGRNHIITSITFSAEKPRDGRSDTFDLNEPIIWWFSKASDHICSWRGRVLPVPEESIKERQHV